MTRAFYVIAFVLLLTFPGQVYAKTRQTYGMPRMQHRRQTVKPYRLETKRQWSPCTKHRSLKSKTSFDYPSVADTTCYAK